MTNDYLRQIFGSLLKIGNCMNAGNKTRGQADGYEIDALGKAFTIKDINGVSIMKTICDKIFEKDEKLVNFKSAFDACYTSLKCKIDEIEKESAKARG
jgi:hypothetical protein